MEKLFTPGKWFVGFCAMFVLIFLSTKYVHDQRMAETGKMHVEKMFTFTFPALGVRSSFEAKEAHIVKSEENEAQIRVSGVQSIVKSSAGAASEEAPQTAQCQALVTLYKDQGKWLVGSFEAE